MRPKSEFQPVGRLDHKGDAVDVAIIIPIQAGFRPGIAPAALT